MGSSEKGFNKIVPNEVKIKGSHPISSHLSTITVGDQTTCLEISDRNGARIMGDLEVIGNIKGNIADVTFDDITFDDITCSTVTIKGDLTVQITGTVAANNGSDAIEGTGTAFTTELAFGDSIKIESDIARGYEIFTVHTVSDDDTLTINSNYEGTNDTGLLAHRDSDLFLVKSGDGVDMFKVDKSGGIDATSLIVDNMTMDINKISGTNNLIFEAENGYGKFGVTGNLYFEFGEDQELVFQEGSGVISELKVSASLPTFILYESAGGTDYLRIATSTNGESYIVTADAAAQAAHLNLLADGNVLIDSYGTASTAEASSLPITLTPGSSVIIDKNLSETTAATSKALHVDLDRTGTVSTGTDTATGIDVDVNHTGASGGIISSYGMDLDIVGDTGGTSIAYGLDIHVSGATTCNGIVLNNKNGGTDFFNASSANATDYFTINTIAAGATTLTTVDTTVGATAHLTLDVDGTITLDSNDGNFIAKKAGTEFSAANSAYAGMILGYTRLEGDLSTQNTFEIQDAFTVEDDTHQISFKTPPSELVEIEATFSINRLSTTDTRICVGISDQDAGDGYQSIGVQYEYDANGISFSDDEIDDAVYIVKWVLPAAELASIGSSNTFWIGFSTAGVTKTAYLSYGVRASHGITEHPFVIKATALPSAIYDGQ